MPGIIDIDHLRKTYGQTVAVDDISLEVHEGEIFGIVGPNGAGKTTTIECLEGLRVPSSGTIRVLGLDPQADRKILRASTGVQLQDSNLPDRMKVWEALDLYSSFYAAPADWNTLIGRLGLETKRNAAFGKLSGGQKQRLFIALALLPDPKVVFLDELTTGLDPQARHAIWDLIRDVRAQGTTVLLTTHFMEEAEKLCDRIAIIDRGRIVAMDTPRNLIRSLEFDDRISFELDDPPLPELVETLSRLGTVDLQGNHVLLQGRSDGKTQFVGRVVKQLTDQGVPFRDLRTEQATLEDVFLKLTGRKTRE
jgi:ABC-2 type transport system ATP-binding protein